MSTSTPVLTEEMRQQAIGLESSPVTVEVEQGAIVKFAQKVALDPQGLSEPDYEAVREQGVSDGEIMEIISLAALGNYLDTLADAVKSDVDSVIKEALAG